MKTAVELSNNQIHHLMSHLAEMSEYSDPMDACQWEREILAELIKKAPEVAEDVRDERQTLANEMMEMNQQRMQEQNNA